MEFKVGAKVRVLFNNRTGVVVEVLDKVPWPYEVQFDNDSSCTGLFQAEELEFAPELEQKSRRALEVTDTAFIAVSTLGPYVELSINDDETIDLFPDQARHVAMMLLDAAEELEE